MRILQVHNYYKTRGGEDVYFDSLVNLLNKNNQSVLTFTRSSRVITVKVDELRAASTIFFNQRILKKLSRTIRRFKPDIVHFHNLFPFITPEAYHIVKQFHIPIVQRIPSYRFICPKGTFYRNKEICEQCAFKRFAYPSIIHKCYRNSAIGSGILSISFFLHAIRKSFDLVDTYVFQADFIRNYYCRLSKIPINKTAILHHFVPQETSNGNFRKNINKYFLFAGRLSEEKGIIELLDVFKQLPTIPLIVVGDGQLRNEVLSYKKYKNIKILLYRPRNEVINLMRKAYFTIIPSPWYETGPFVLMESYSVGTPVIASDIGVLSKEVIHAKTGYLFRNKNYNELKTIIDSAYNNGNRKTYMSMRKYAKEEFNRHYTEKIHYKILMKIYRRLL